MSKRLILARGRQTVITVQNWWVIRERAYGGQIVRGWVVVYELHSSLHVIIGARIESGYHRTTYKNRNRKQWNGACYFKIVYQRPHREVVAYPNRARSADSSI